MEKMMEYLEKHGVEKKSNEEQSIFYEIEDCKTPVGFMYKKINVVFELSGDRKLYDKRKKLEQGIKGFCKEYSYIFKHDMLYQEERIAITKCNDYNVLIGEASKDAWMIFKTHTDAFNQPDKWWDDLLSEIEKTVNKYKGTDAELYIWHYLTFVIMPEIERMSKADKKGIKQYAVTEESYKRIMGEKRKGEGK